MNFVNPNFLWALFAVSIPIIIHLINFRRHKLVYFSNTEFLKNIKKESQRINKLKNLLILISRILIIAMLVIAFAGPYIPNDKSQNKQISVTAIYIDNSYSMQSDSKAGKNIEQAKNIAKHIIMKNPENMEYILITNSYLSEYQRILDRNTIIDYIDAIEINPQIITLSDIILKIKSLVEENKITNLFLISDMQKTIFNNEKIDISNNINLHLLSIPFLENNNIFIDTCYFENPIHRLNQKELLKVKIINKTNEEVVDFPLYLYINDSLKAMTNCNLQANEEKTVDIEFINTTEAEQNCKLSIFDFPITYDNDLFFTYNVIKTSNVLIINSKTENKYINTLFNTNTEEIQYNNVSINSVQTSSFNNYDVIILNNIETLTSGLISDLQNFVNSGASLLIIPDEKIDESKLNELMKNFSATSFTSTIIANTKIKNIDYQHEIFKNVFLKQEKQLQLPQINGMHKINNYNSSSMSVVLSDEMSNPILLAGNSQGGKLYLFTFPFKENNREFLSSSLFVSSFLNIIYNTDILSSLYFNINNTQADLALKSQDVNSEAFRIFNKENKIDNYLNFINDGKKIIFNIPNDLSRSGFYEILNIENDTLSSLSLNYDRNESKLNYFGKKELQKYNEEYLSGRADIMTVENSLITQFEDKLFSDGEQIWEYFIYLAILFLIIEIVIIKLL